MPCLSHAGDLLGCEACGVAANPSPGAAKLIEEASPFVDPLFYPGLLESFTPSEDEGAAAATLAFLAAW